MAYNKAEKKAFIAELIQNNKAVIFSKLDKLPPKWDGVELRWYIAEQFQTVISKVSFDKKSKRYQTYKNACITKNL